MALTRTLCFRLPLNPVLNRLPCLTSKRGCVDRTSHENEILLRGNKKKRLSYYHNPGTKPFQMITTGQLLNAAAEKWPDRVAIISHHEEKQLTFQQLKDQVDQLGASLLKLGLKPGDRLALLGMNSLHWYISLLAAAKAGLVTVMLNPAYRVKELEFALKKARVSGIITDHLFLTQDYPKMLSQLIPGMSSAVHGQSISCSQLPDLSFVVVATEDKLPGCYRLKDIKTLAANKQEIKDVEDKIQPDDAFCILFSSGTTGVPKGSVLSHFGVINNSYFVGARFGIGDKHSMILVQLPFFHIFGTTLGVFFAIDNGSTIVLSGPIFDKDSTIEVLQKHKCDFIAGTPTMFIDLCDKLKTLLPTSTKYLEACGNVEITLCGGAPVSSEVVKVIQEVFPKTNLMVGYGMTETSGSITSCLMGDTWENKTTTVGCLAEHVEVKIVDGAGKMVPFGTPGEAWFRGICNLAEYWGDEEKTKEAKTKDGWFKSGDIMTLREDGYLSIIGRNKDMIIRGGENIFPAEIENFLLQHPEIFNAEVYGVVDPRLGEEVAASIKLMPTSTLTADRLKEYCKGKISHFKIPKYIRFVDQYPLTPVGKVKKYVLKETHEQELKRTKG